MVGSGSFGFGFVDFGVRVRFGSNLSVVGSGSFGFGFVDFGVRVHSASGLICRWLARVHSASDLSILGFGFIRLRGRICRFWGSASFGFGSNLSVVGSGSFGFWICRFWGSGSFGFGSNLSVVGSGSFGFGFVDFGVRVHSASGLICRWLARVHSASDLSILGFGFIRLRV